MKTEITNRKIHEDERSDLATQKPDKTHNCPLENNSFVEVSIRYNRSTEVTTLPPSLD
jgi:hypothetical protein